MSTNQELTFDVKALENAQYILDLLSDDFNSKILKAIHIGGRVNVTQLHKAIRKKQSITSTHLMRLYRAGLIKQGRLKTVVKKRKYKYFITEAELARADFDPYDNIVYNGKEHYYSCNYVKLIPIYIEAVRFLYILNRTNPIDSPTSRFHN